MLRAIDILMEEHRVIETVMDSLEACVAFMRAGETVRRKTIGEYGEFFRHFADALHHAKEEDRLFVIMQRYGFSAHEGPLFVMESEHEEGRKHVAALLSLGEGETHLTPQECEMFAHHATEFVTLLRNHIYKEDNVLYPMALRAIPPGEFAELAEAFDSFAKSLPGMEEKYRLLAQNLLARYPALEEDDCGDHGGCAGCTNRFCEDGMR